MAWTHLHGGGIKNTEESLRRDSIQKLNTRVIRGDQKCQKNATNGRFGKKLTLDREMRGIEDARARN